MTVNVNCMFFPLLRL